MAGRQGETDRRDAVTVIAAIRQAVELVHAGQASAVVTNPIHKAALTRTGFAFPGHTEFLGALSEEVFGVAAQPVMMIAASMLKVVPVTIHIPLAAVAVSESEASTVALDDTVESMGRFLPGIKLIVLPRLGDAAEAWREAPDLTPAIG